MRSLSALILLASVAPAGEVRHTLTVLPQATNWSQSWVLPKHEPALGALQSVTVSVHIDMTGSLAIENVSPGQASYTGRTSVDTLIADPNGTAILAPACFVGHTIHLAAFDGTANFGGLSGQTWPSLAAGLDDAQVLQVPADLALFTAASPGESITLGLAAFGTSSLSGPGAPLVQQSTSAAMRVTVRYAFREVCHTVSFPSASTDWSQSVSIPRHDSALGPLQAVRLYLNSTASGTVRAESVKFFPVWEFFFAAAATLARPNGSVLGSVIPVQRFVDRIMPFDGTIDFGGTSGVTYTGIQAEAWTEVTLTSPTDLALFSSSAPGDVVQLPLVAAGVGFLVSGGNPFSQFITSAAVTITVCYDYSSPIEGFCAGDGSGAACPCGNPSASGANEGCLNSFNLGGRLRGSGVAQIGFDTLVLDATNLPPNTTALLYQGTTASAGGAGTVFGDGLRCAGGIVRRLYAGTTSSGNITFPLPGAQSISIAGLTSVGDTRHYQVWYRNAASFCTASTFNLTNGVRIPW